MQPIKEFVEELVGERGFETSPQDAYAQVMWALERRIAEMDRAVWSPRLSPEEYVYLKKKREQIQDDLAMVRGLANKQAGIKENPKPIQTRKRPRSGYGEP